MDLDDRYFCQAWQGIERKPIEYRELYHPTSTVSQGVVKLWAEINQKDSTRAQAEQHDITPEPVKEFEVRLVIWKTKDLREMDWEGCSDVFIRAYFDANDDKDTDTHWRCSGGTASFNYRLKFKLNSQPRTREPSYKLTIQAWDKDIFSSNDLIGACELDIAPLMNDALATGRQMVLNETYFVEHM